MRGVRRVNHGRARLAQPAMGARQFQPVTQAETGAVAGGQASPPAVAVMPMAEVLVYPDPATSGYSTVAYRGLHPVWAPDGETILARAPGRWGQLRAAGRP